MGWGRVLWGLGAQRGFLSCFTSPSVFCLLLPPRDACGRVLCAHPGAGLCRLPGHPLAGVQDAATCSPSTPSSALPGRSKLWPGPHPVPGRRAVLEHTWAQLARPAVLPPAPMERHLPGARGRCWDPNPIPGAVGGCRPFPSQRAARCQRGTPQRWPEEMLRSRREPACGDWVDRAQEGGELRQGPRNHTCGNGCRPGEQRGPFLDGRIDCYPLLSAGDELRGGSRPGHPRSPCSRVRPRHRDLPPSTSPSRAGRLCPRLAAGAARARPRRGLAGLQRGAPARLRPRARRTRPAAPGRCVRSRVWPWPPGPPRRK
ncbi:steroidogenic acute regulatory protein, mitochondrial isoform X3 [Tyto alba]|uniref:steroidogenic acute regulatory protein, mitochondrial isoform X3 n=1 Tax=Tyto alba TaxID=56313 RepID=UPI001C68678E|nr:steroidogenic acute regulatory protein, mitochondrial isoform X3 [Tyto alba]